MTVNVPDSLLAKVYEGVVSVAGVVIGVPGVKNAVIAASAAATAA